MATEVVNSYNIYVDSERCLSQSSKGDNIMLALNQTPITCADNQYIRLTLQSFSMYKSFTNVNPNNNVFRVSGTFTSPPAPNPAIADVPCYMKCQDYQGRNEMGENFATVLANNLATFTGVPLATAYLFNPSLDTGGAAPPPVWGSNNEGVWPPIAGRPTDNIIQFYIVFSGAHGITDLQIRSKISDGDNFELLGGDRIYDTDPANKSSVFIDLAPDLSAWSTPPAAANVILVQCKYNSQLSTQQNVYLRTDLNTTNIQTESFNSENTDIKNANQLSSSRILGKLVIDNEFINYTTGTQMEYFINLTTKQVTMMRLFLTDSHGRPIPQNVLYTESTDPGPPVVPGNSFLNVPVEQATLGNRSFECVIKVDIVQYMGGQNGVLNSRPPVKTVPARFGTEPLNEFDYGKSGYPDQNFSRMTIS